jgi:hypothetical protein
MFAMGEQERRRCGRCGAEKPLEEFAWRRKAKGQRHNYCRPCHSAYHREHYLKNKQRYIDQAGRRKRAIAEVRFRYILEYFRSHPCTDCEESDPLVLEFDHVGEKNFNVSTALRVRNWQSILEEIAKCEVVCANCHRRRTARRSRSLRLALVTQLASPSNL